MGDRLLKSRSGDINITSTTNLSAAPIPIISDVTADHSFTLSASHMHTNMSITASRLTRRGKDLLVRGQITFSGTNTETPFFLTMPSGLSIDFTGLSVSRLTVGQWSYLNSGGAVYNGAVKISTGSYGAPLISFEGIDGATPLPPVAYSAGVTIGYMFEIPIAEWSETQLLSAII